MKRIMFAKYTFFYIFAFTFLYLAFWFDLVKKNLPAFFYSPLYNFLHEEFMLVMLQE